MQVYEILHGHSNDMYYASSGMLLAKNLHHAYDALKWSLYQKVRDGCLYREWCLSIL